MKIFAVELKGKEANLCLLSLKQGMFSIPDCRSQKLVLSDAFDNQQMRQFQKSFKKLVEDYQVEHIVIKTRETRGKHAGSAESFKMETAIQLIDDLDVTFISNAEIKEKLKRSPLSVDFRGTGLRQFQENAFVAGYAFLSQ
ncbi:DUF3010 family protein [Photobacterium sp. CAU 1568]|uniref:DUF3010 family protein n=1 Tax=Photobacterium arenosum TaxID=2774143 RepID=A0ABR9BG22_9GAMM|nr:DUF3010 family protein [Photobacterium arenosum]MBD8511503.1 DUF3010 family protein [Photobacterium arenosum]